MEPTLDDLPRTYIIKKSQHVGYGFIVGHELPTMVKKVEINGPSHDRLRPGDVMMAINGINVENVPMEKIIKMIQLSNDQIEIKVRQLTYEELIRAKNLNDPKFYQLNKANTTASSNHYSQRYHQPSTLPNNKWQFNRLVTSISQQQHLPLQPSPSSASNCTDQDSIPVQITSIATASKQILKQKSINLADPNDTETKKSLESKHNAPKYGRFSPVPQRCKSSIDSTQGNQKNKKSDGDQEDQPSLKRRNTMRPLRPPPPEVREILKVVIKIFFEEGHSRTLKYSNDTTVGVILNTLNERLGKLPEQVEGYFGLALTVGVDCGNGSKDKAPKRKLLYILDENDSIMKIGQLPYSHRLRLLYRMVYPPSDVYNLYQQSKPAFKYLYQQSCNDLKLERFNPELDEDTALKMSALYLLEYVHSNHSKSHGSSKDPKVYIKLIKKTRGIEYFVPMSIAEGVLDKDGKRIVSQYKKLKAKLIKQLKKNFEEFNFEPPKVKSTTDINRFSTTSFHELIIPEMQSSPSDYIKLLFLNYLSQLPCYGNPKKPVRASTSPIDQNSTGDCSSSMESVPRTSDSLPLIKQDRHQISHLENNNINGRTDHLGANNISRIAQMNSMRSLNSVHSSNLSQPVDQPDMVATPSIESISSIAFNMHNSPSPPDATPPYLSRSIEPYNNLSTGGLAINSLGPSPMPRHQTLPPRRPDFSSIDKLYNQRYSSNEKSIDDIIKSMMIPPLPPPPCFIFDDLAYQVARGKVDYAACSKYLTQVLTDQDIEKLRVPPPPRIINKDPFSL